MNDNFDIIILRDITSDNAESDKREEFKTTIPHYLKSFETYFVSREGNKDSQKAVPAKEFASNFAPGM